MSSAASVASLLQGLRRHNPSSPRLIWYGTGGERVELSGKVLDNWVAKTANLLVDDLDATGDSNVLLAMPPHWRSLCWVLASWQVGATVTLQPLGFGGSKPDDDDGAPATEPAVAQTAEGTGQADVVVTTEPDQFAADTAPPQYLVAVALGALQLQWDGELPADTVDYAGEVRSHGDEYMGLSEPEPASDALRYDSVSIRYEQLFSGFALQELQELQESQGLQESTANQAGPHGARAETVLVSAGLPLSKVLQIALGAWAAGGAVVLVHPQAQVTESLISSERITHRFGVDPS